MEAAPDLQRLSLAFALEAMNIPADAPISSAIWPTVGSMVDHLGSIQRWATKVLQTGRSVSRSEHQRPADRNALEWFREGAQQLVEEISQRDPALPCWTLAGPGQASFWGRRMVHEAAKHLWDLRTALTRDPPLPPEVDPHTPEAIIDEFDEVFITLARARGIEGLPGSVLLQPMDSARLWRIEPDWRVVRDQPGDRPSAVLRASVADLALVLWERADPWSLPRRFAREGDESTLRALCEARIHL